MKSKRWTLNLLSARRNWSELFQRQRWENIRETVWGAWVSLSTLILPWTELNWGDPAGTVHRTFLTVILPKLGSAFCLPPPPPHITHETMQNGPNQTTNWSMTISRDDFQWRDIKRPRITVFINSVWTALSAALMESSLYLSQCKHCHFHLHAILTTLARILSLPRSVLCDLISVLNNDALLALICMPLRSSAECGEFRTRV